MYNLTRFIVLNWFYRYDKLLNVFKICRFWYLRLTVCRVETFRIHWSLSNYMDNMWLLITAWRIGLCRIERRSAKIRCRIRLLNGRVFTPASLLRTTASLHMLLGICFFAKTCRSSRYYAYFCRIHRSPIQSIHWRFGSEVYGWGENQYYMTTNNAHLQGFIRIQIRWIKYYLMIKSSNSTFDLIWNTALHISVGSR